MPSLTCVIVTKDREASLLRLLRSIERQQPRPDEVIVVNDAGAEVRLPEFSFPVRQIRNPESINSGRSRNIGVEAARTEAILLLDDDVELRGENFLSEGLALFAAPEVLLVYPRKIDRRGEEEAEYSFCRINPATGELPWIPLEAAKERLSQGQSLLGPMVCFVRRSAFIKVGGYRHCFGWGVGHSFREESDFQLRLQRLPDARAVIAEQAFFGHHIQASGGHGSKLQKRVFWIAHNQVVFAAEHLRFWPIKSLGFALLELPRYAWGNGRFLTLPAGWVGMWAGAWSAFAIRPLQRLAFWVAILLALGILPSFTALWAGLVLAHPFLAFMGPPNVIKLGTPFFLLFLTHPESRAKLPSRRFLSWLGLALIAGTLLTAHQFIRCAYYAIIPRQWAVLIWSLLAGMVFWCLSGRARHRVAGTWFGVVLTSTALEIASPRSINFLMKHFFDPQMGSNLPGPFQLQAPLVGIWDTGSLGKLSALTSVVLLGALASRRSGVLEDSSDPAQARGLDHVSWLVLGSGLLALLASGQRGALVGLAVGCLVYAIGVSWMERTWKFAATGAALLLSCAGAGLLAFGPQRMLARIASIFGVNLGGADASFAMSNREARFKIWSASVEGITHSPLGNACLPDELYRRHGAGLGYHSHNMFLEQFLQRGWLWGTAFFSAWVFAFALWGRAANSHQKMAWIAALACATAIGMFDHPIFVLAQGVLYAVLWLSPFMAPGLRRADGSPAGTEAAIPS